MLVGGDWKRLEAALINVPHAARMMMGVPALGVRHRQPAKKFRNLLILTLPGPNHEMPMVRHHDIAENPQRHALVGFGDRLLEGREIGVFSE